MLAAVPAQERWSFLDAVRRRRLHGARRRLRRLRRRAAPLAEAGYAGWLIVEAEQDPAKAHPLTYAKKGYAHLRAAAEKVGFQVAA